MKYVFMAMMIVISSFFLRPAQASIFSVCSATLLNCTGEENSLAWCAYDGDSFWDTMYSATSGYLNNEESTSDVECSGSESSCYVVADITGSIYVCTSFDTDGFVDCNEYACVDEDLNWNTSDSEFSCSDNSCVTD